jgi:spoIIIJ-associated protein
VDWVETTGRTIEEATAEALGELGVTMSDAEIVVLSEPRPGLFGRVRSEARVRVRVRPSTPQGSPGNRRRDRPGGAAPGQAAPEGRHSSSEGSTTAAISGGAFGGEVKLAEQAEVAQAFLTGVLDRFGVSAEVGISEVDDGVTEVAVSGGDLALLVGSRGATVDALQDLARVVVQRRTGALQGRLLVDVAGYRRKRRLALETFTRERAAEVLRDGVELVLEPMAPADRKVVHTTAGTIQGVSTHSEGEEPRRRVVMSPSA